MAKKLEMPLGHVHALPIVLIVIVNTNSTLANDVTGRPVWGRSQTGKSLKRGNRLVMGSKNW